MLFKTLLFKGIGDTASMWHTEIVAFELFKVLGIWQFLASVPQPAILCWTRGSGVQCTSVSYIFLVSNVYWKRWRLDSVTKGYWVCILIRHYFCKRAWLKFCFQYLLSLKQTRWAWYFLRIYMIEFSRKAFTGSASGSCSLENVIYLSHSTSEARDFFHKCLFKSL